MTKMNKFFSITVLTVLIISLFTLAVNGQEPGSYPVAEPRFSSSEIIWVPLVSYSLLDLTIARPDGTLFSRTFDAGGTPYADLSNILGKGDLDGSYIYELRAMTEPRQKRGEDDEVEIRYSTAPLVQTGAFFVLDNRIIIPEEQEPDRDKGKGLSFSNAGPGLSGVQDFVINDDLIVIGSACIGFDCVNGEVFDFDTIRLKENNLRIKFDDTSTIGSFPRNDWQLTANDSANGGASKFSIDDITNVRTPFTVEANARSNSLYVDDGGRIGIRTSTPALEIHVVDGDTPALRLQQDGSSGFAPQTWDIAGNEANFFVRDVTNGSKLPFRIQPGAPSNVLTLRGDGRVGIGTWGPSYPVHLITNSSTNAEILAERTSGAQAQLGAASSLAYIGARTDHEVRFQVNSDWRMRLNPTSNTKVLEVRLGGSGGAYSDGTDWFPSSSREVKENINSLTLDQALQALNGLNPVTYNYKINKKEERVGFIAEDVPELVAVNGRKHLNSMDIVAVLTKVVQEQQKLNKEQQESIKEQKKIISDLNKRIAELEKNSK